MDALLVETLDATSLVDDPVSITPHPGDSQTQADAGNAKRFASQRFGLQRQIPFPGLLTDQLSDAATPPRAGNRRQVATTNAGEDPMSTSSTTLHEDPTVLTLETIDLHRGFVSLMEELEAIDWYNQRVQATQDTSLKEILEHNRDEEKEHAVMLLEWLRRHDPALDKEMRTYLFAESGTSIIDQEENAADTSGPGSADGSLHIGTLKEVQA